MCVSLLSVDSQSMVFVPTIRFRLLVCFRDRIVQNLGRFYVMQFSGGCDVEVMLWTQANVRDPLSLKNYGLADWLQKITVVSS